MIPILYAPRELGVSYSSYISALADPADTTYGQGYGGLYDCISMKVTEERNGSYEMEFKYPVTGQLFDKIQTSSLIMAKPFVGGQNQIFRVYKVSKPINGICTIYAEHISYILSYTMSNVAGAMLTNVTIQDIFDYISGRVINVNGDTFPFTFVSQISSQIRIPKYNMDIPYNVRQLLGGMTNSVLDLYKTGEYEFDNLTVKFSSERGTDRGTKITYGKNLTDIKHEVDDENIITAVMPYYYREEESGDVSRVDYYTLSTALGVDPYDSSITYSKDDLCTTRTGVARPVTWISKVDNNTGHTPASGSAYWAALGDVVTSETAQTNFPYYARVLSLDMSQEEEYNEVAPTAAQMLSYAKRYFATHNVEQVQETIEVSFIDLSSTTEYENILPLETVRLCDTVHVEYADLGITADLKVIKTEFDVLEDRYSKITLGSARSSFVNSVTTVEEFTEEMNRTKATRYNVNDAARHLTELVQMLGGGYKTEEEGYIYFHDQPTLEESTYIVKIGTAGVMFSSDGGATWNSGWGVDGQAYFQMATAWRLNAERLDVGFISADGTKNGNYWDLDTGAVQLMGGTRFNVDGTVKTFEQIQEEINNAFDESYDRIAGTLGVRFRGEYDASVRYDKYDVVSYAPAWSSSTTYAEGDIVTTVVSGEKVYWHSLSNNNTNHAPADGSAYWEAGTKKYWISRQDANTNHTPADDSQWWKWYDVSADIETLSNGLKDTQDDLSDTQDDLDGTKDDLYGTLGSKFKGLWSASATYSKDDIVYTIASNVKHYWRSKKDSNTNHSPVAGEWWAVQGLIADVSSKQDGMVWVLKPDGTEGWMSVVDYINTKATEKSVEELQEDYTELYDDVGDITGDVSTLADNIVYTNTLLGVTHKGTWNASTTYAKDDLVDYNNKKYVSLVNGNTNHTPPSVATSDSYWRRFQGFYLDIEYLNTSAAIFDILTDHGDIQGIFTAVDPVTDKQYYYVNADYIQGGTINGGLVNAAQLNAALINAQYLQVNNFPLCGTDISSQVIVDMTDINVQILRVIEYPFTVYFYAIIVPTKDITISGHRNVFSNLPHIYDDVYLGMWYCPESNNVRTATINSYQDASTGWEYRSAITRGNNVTKDNRYMIEITYQKA